MGDEGMTEIEDIKKRLDRIEEILKKMKLQKTWQGNMLMTQRQTKK